MKGKRRFHLLCQTGLALPAGMAAAIDSSWQSPVSGSFIDPVRWSTNPNAPNNGAPNPTDGYRAFISATGSAYTVTLNNPVTLDALTLDSPDVTFRHTFGVLQVPELNLKRGNWVLGDLAFGGTIKGATIRASNGAGILVPSAARSGLDGVTLGAPLTIQSTGGSTRLRLYNGLTLAGATITMDVTGNQIWIDADGVQTISGTGEIVFANGMDFCRIVNSNHTGNLTLGPGVTIRTGGGGGIIGSPGGTVTNDGLISAQTAPGTIVLDGNIVNHGTMRAVNFGTLTIPLGAFTNAGTVVLDQNSTLNLRGTITEAGLGNFQRNGGTVVLNGEVPNVGSSLSLDAFSGGWELNGLIDGGAINAGAINHTLKITGGNLHNGVTLNCDVTAGVVNVFDGLTLNGTMSLIGSGTLNFSTGSQLFNGTGVVRFDGESGPNKITTNSATSLTIGPGITLMSGSYGATIGAAGMALTNSGLISSRTIGKTILVTGTSVTNTGTLEARDGGLLKVTNLLGPSGNLSISNGGQMDLDGKYTLAGNVNVPAGSSLTLRGVWSNAANMTGGGSFVLITPPMGNSGVIRSQTAGATVTFNSAFTNSGLLEAVNGGTLVLSAPISGTGTISVDVLSSATIAGGRQHRLIVGGRVTMRNKSAGGTTLVLDELSIAQNGGAWMGKLDIADDALIVDYATASPLADIISQIRSGRAGGAWTGNGITTSRAGPNTTIGVGEASSVLGLSEGQTGTWQGQTVDSTAVLARLTYFGDADLDGVVDFNDLVRLAQNYNDTSASRLWPEGDFNDDGSVNFNDLVALAQNYNAAPLAGLPVDFQADFERALASVPEPSCLLVVAAAPLLGRRRRRGYI